MLKRHEIPNRNLSWKVVGGCTYLGAAPYEKVERRCIKFGHTGH